MIRKQELLELQKHEGDALISLIAPMEKVYPASDKNPIIMKNLVREAERQLIERLGPETARKLIDELNILAQEIDFKHTGNGIALFVSENFRKKLDLPLSPEKEMIRIGKTFQTRDIITAIYKSPKYIAVNLSAQGVRLYRGIGTEIEEVRTNFFPAVYQGPSRTEALSKITRQDTDSEELEDIRIFLRSVDENLYEIVHNEKTPLFIFGESEYISFLTNHGKCSPYIKGQANENLVHLQDDAVGEKIYQNHVIIYYEGEKLRLLQQLEEAKGYNRSATGLLECWKVAQNGQVMTLLVEEHFHAAAEIHTDHSISIIDPEAGNGKMITRFSEDIVSDLIEKVIEMDGEVVIVNDGMLTNNENVAAILRYGL